MLTETKNYYFEIYVENTKVNVPYVLLSISQDKQRNGEYRIIKKRGCHNKTLIFEKMTLITEW